MPLSSSALLPRTPAVRRGIGDRVERVHVVPAIECEVHVDVPSAGRAEGDLSRAHLARVSGVHHTG